MPKLNVKLLLWTAGLALVVTAAAYLLHLFQTGRIAQALLWQARRAEQEDRPDQTDKLLSRYLELAPDDVEERAHLGRVLARKKGPAAASSHQRALFLLEQVLAREPNRPDCRRLLARVAMTMGHYDLALEHLKALPQDSDVLPLLGRAYEAKRDYARAKDCYQKAIQAAPDRIATYERLADLLRRQPDPTATSHPPRSPAAVMDQLVANNERSVPAHLARWRYLIDSDVLAGWRGLRESGAAADAAQLEKDQPAVRVALEKAGQDVGRALELAPAEADVLLAAAELEQARGQLATARQHLQKGLQRHPQNPRLYQALASLEVRAGRRPEAIACLRQAVKVLTGPGQSDVRWTLANLLLDGGDRDAAREQVDRMAQGNASAVAVDYLRARLLVQERKWAAAAPLLERTRVLMEGTPELSRDTDHFLGEIDGLLGQCYEQLNDLGRQSAAWARLAARDPASASAHLQLARAHAAAGRLDEALSEYRQATALPGAPAGAAAELARLVLARNLQREAPDWAEVSQALARAEQAQPGSVEVVLLRAGACEAQNQLETARKLLEEARQRKPEQAELPLALAALAQRRGARDEARRLLEESKGLQGDTVAWRLASARYWAGSPGKEAEAALGRLEQGLSRYSADDQARLLQGLAEVYLRLDHVKDALRLWARLAELPQSGDDLRVQTVLVDLAVQAGDDATAARAVEAVRRIEGGQGPWWRFGEASRLIQRGRQGDPAALARARVLLDEVGARLPAWSAVPFAKAEIEILQGNSEQALADYREAINLGEHGPRVVRQVVQILHQLQRYREADQEIRLLQKHVRLSADLQRLAVDIALRNQDPAAALKLAREVVAADSKDYRDYLWLGQVLAASGQRPAEAEQNLRRAIQLAEHAPETWVALIEFLVSRNRPDQAEIEIQNARARLGAEQAPLAVAQCYEALGRPEQARAWYQKALAARPADVAVRRSAAGFALRTRHFADAEPLLRPLVDRRVPASAADVTWARHNLAWALAARGDWQRFGEALQLVGLGLDPAGKVVAAAANPPDADPVEEERVRARILATQEVASLRDAAIARFEELGKRQTLTTDDQFRLAGLYDAAGAWPRAREQYRNLLAGQGNNPLYLSRYAQSLLAHRQLEEAGQVIERLERLAKARALDPGAYGTIELRARLQEARGKGDEAVALLKPYVTRKGAGPEEVLVLAGYLARQGRLREALDCCEQAWKTCPPVVAGGASLAALRAAPPGAEHYARVDRWLRTAVEKNPAEPMLLLQLAELRDLQARYPEAEAIYRQILKQDSHNVVALNNLAWLLAERSPDAAEARELINQAIERHGPRPELLSTRAMVDLSQGRLVPAIEYLETATTRAPTATGYFYLAAAHLKARNRDAALKALTEAKRRQFSPRQLHPLEQEYAQRVLDALHAP